MIVLDSPFLLKLLRQHSNDLALMWSVLRLLATNGFYLASINIELESKDAVLHPLLSECVKELLDDCSQQCHLMFRWTASPSNVVNNFFGMCFRVVAHEIVSWW
jgi:hypothetical protein